MTDSTQHSEAIRAVVEMWTGFVEGGIPEKHATEIIVAMITNAQQKDSPDMLALFQHMQKQ